MSTISASLPGPEPAWSLPGRGKVGMACLIVAEAAIFTIFVVAYIYDLGKGVGGPTPAQILRMPILDTVCLLASSLTIHAAVDALRRGSTRAFLLWWAATFGLGLKFIEGTGAGWYQMIYHQGFSISTNLFGTSFYALVGLHATHVIVGLLGLGLVLALGLAGKIQPEHAGRCEVFSYYWHFVDGVWVVVFTVVYLLGR